jgi:hypothetical protein
MQTPAIRTRLPRRSLTAKDRTIGWLRLLGVSVGTQDVAVNTYTNYESRNTNSGRSTSFIMQALREKAPHAFTASTFLHISTTKKNRSVRLDVLHLPT